jgi:hypothetical protein
MVCQNLFDIPCSCQTPSIATTGCPNDEDRFSSSFHRYPTPNHIGTTAITDRFIDAALDKSLSGSPVHSSSSIVVVETYPGLIGEQKRHPMV